MRRAVIFLASLLLLAPSQAVGVTISDEMELSVGRFDSTNSSNHIGYLAYPRSSGLDVRSSFLLGMKLDSQDKPVAVALCDSVDACVEMNRFSVGAILPTCSARVTSNCVESFFARDASGKRLEVIPQGLFSDEEHHNFKGDPEIGIPDGVSPTLYRIPEAPHEAGDLYLPLVTRSGAWERTSQKMRDFDNTAISLYAVKIVDGSYSLFEPSVNVLDYELKGQINSTGPDDRCIYNDSKKCAIAYAIPTNVVFGFTVRYPSLSQNWFHGRVMDPQVSLSNARPDAVVVTVSARAIQSSGFFTLKRRSDLPSPVVQDFDGIVGGRGSCTGPGLEASCYNSNLWQTSREMDRFLRWLDVAGDKASFDPTVWTINAMNQPLEHPRAGQCTPSGQVVGLVSTNATQYLAGPPVHNSATGELEYKVAAPHLRSDGSLFRGTYDLAINSEYARCLYGLAGSTIRASVSVTSSAGELVSATANQNIKDGWLYLSASNFTFSSPTIKVKLTQDVSLGTPTATPAPTPVVSPLLVQPLDKTRTAGAKKRVSITCVKDSMSKKVTGLKPKCPKGYKRA